MSEQHIADPLTGPRLEDLHLHEIVSAFARYNSPAVETAGTLAMEATATFDDLTTDVGWHGEATSAGDELATIGAGDDWYQIYDVAPLQQVLPERVRARMILLTAQPPPFKIDSPNLSILFHKLVYDWYPIADSGDDRVRGIVRMPSHPGLTQYRIEEGGGERYDRTLAAVQKALAPSPGRDTPLLRRLRSLVSGMRIEHDRQPGASGEYQVLGARQTTQLANYLALNLPDIS